MNRAHPAAFFPLGLSGGFRCWDGIEEAIGIKILLKTNLILHLMT